MMKSNLRKFRTGQALVEFAIVLTLFLILVLGVIDWGLYMFSVSIYETATRDSVRAAVTWSDWKTNSAARTTQVNTMIVNRTNILPANLRTGVSGRVQISFNPSLTSIETITVAINNQPFTPVSGFLGPLVPNTISVATTMQYEP